MRYTRTELGLFDAFALILAGLGLVFLIVGALALATKGLGSVVVSGASRGWAPALLGTAFLALGAALGAGVRRVVRNGGEDVAEFPHVPMAGSVGTRR